MNDDRDIAAAFNEGLGSVMDETPPVPEWDSLQFESMSPSGGMGGWWVAVVAAALVLVVGAGSFLFVGQIDDNDAGEVGGDDEVVAVDDPGSDSIAGVWILESWTEGGIPIAVEVGENTPDEPWVEFTETFAGERGSFVSADGTGTAGSFVVWTGCASSEPGEYEYSAGFLVLGPMVIESEGCGAAAIERGLDAAEDVFLAMLSRGDGMEIIAGGDRMEWYGSYVGTAYPLVFRRLGAPPAEPTATTTTVAPEEGFAIRGYDVGGIEVVTPSMMSTLPEQASRVEFHTTVIDSGSGPVLCLGGVQQSLPPQCGGPVATGLDMNGWTEEAQGVRWGDRSVVVTWPPVDGAVEVLDQSEYSPPDVVYPSRDLPLECRETELRAEVDAIHEYRQSLGELDGDVYLATDGTLVLQVVGDPEPHREALDEIGGACVIEVARTAAEQRVVQETVYLMLRDIAGITGPYASSTGPGGRVDIYVPVADRATAAFIAGLVDDPTAIRLIGSGVILP